MGGQRYSHNPMAGEHGPVVSPVTSACMGGVRERGRRGEGSKRREGEERGGEMGGEMKGEKGRRGQGRGEERRRDEKGKSVLPVSQDP